jgi:hypothetical protein
MAYKMIEARVATHQQIRDVFIEFDMLFDEYCNACNERLPTTNDYEGNTLCAACKSVSGEYSMNSINCQCGDCVELETENYYESNYEEPENKPCECCGVQTKEQLCKVCEAEALETPMCRFLEVEYANG